MAFFSYSPDRFFQKLVRAFDRFCRHPSEDGLMDVVLVLCHLREWLHPARDGEKAAAKIRAKPVDQRTRAETLYLAVGELSEFSIVVGLCNHAKHFEIGKPIDSKMEKFEGFRAGLGRAGDSLGVTHFTVDRVEVRDIIWPIYKLYFDYFEAEQPGIASAALQA